MLTTQTETAKIKEFKPKTKTVVSHNTIVDELLKEINVSKTNSIHEMTSNWFSFVDDLNESMFSKLSFK